MISLFVSTYLKFFFLLTPFFVLSTFLALTTEHSPSEKTTLAVKVTIAVLIVALVIFGAGNFVFQIFGITLDAFRVGTGILLLLTAISLVNGGESLSGDHDKNTIAVVPLAIPVTVGPATTGALLVMGGELGTLEQTLVSMAAIALAILSVGGVLLASGLIERVIKKQGIIILSKITGLILAALAAQLILIGIRSFLR